MKSKNHKKSMISVKYIWTVAAIALTWSGASAQAGVFNTPHFVVPGEFAIGLEPEVILTNGAGVGVNARFTLGVTDLNNASIILGTGSGPRGFRGGGNFTFDFFPDVEGQAGIGLATQLLYYRLANNAGQLELTLIPYIHKTFKNGPNSSIEPFIAIPLGWGFNDGQYNFLADFTLGTAFQSTEKVSFILELGVAISHTESYFSGGVVYRH